MSDEPAMQLDARNLGILLGAAILIGALSAPWYVLDMAAAREALGANTPQVPGMLGQFVREIASVLPDRITASAWDVFERGDIIMLVAALAAGLAALLDRHEVSTFAGAGAAGLIVVAMLDRPGDVPQELISLSWGPWLALGGALLIVAASRIGSAEPEPAAEIDWTKPIAQPIAHTWSGPAAVVSPAPAPGDASRSVPPPQ